MMQKIILTLSFLICTSFYTTAQEVKLKKTFNGKNFKGWVVPDNNIWWVADKGLLSAQSGPEKKGSILWTEKSYTNFIIETEFLFGEGIIDSGIFLRNDKQQIQIGISGSLKRDMTASPYIPGKGYPVEAKNVAKLLKLTDWNTMKVQAIGGEYKVWLNGEHVMTYESDNAIEEGPIGLQLHGGKVMQISFRNIKIGKI
jgi:hypothetical protein